MENIISNQAPGTNTKDYVRVFGSKVHLNSTGTNTITTFLAPDVAGCIVRTDRDFYPWFSPAGARRGRILNLVKLSSTLTKQAKDTLYNLGVNPVVTFAEEGTLLYGDKTGESSTSTLSRINVSRLFIYVKKALAPVARSILFEQNDATTRLRFKVAAEGFLDRIVSQRGIQEYKVICDSSNNTPEVIEANQFVADILIKPITSINYVLVTLTNKDLSSTL
jgi:phage tail sheath protein FI